MMWENHLKWFGHMQSKPTNVLIKQIELINLGYIKKTSFGRRRHDGVIRNDIDAKGLN